MITAAAKGSVLEAESPEKFRREFSRIHPRAVDQLAADTAEALHAGVPSLKVGARASGLTPSGFSHWWAAASRVGPIHDAAEFVAALVHERKASAGRIVAHFRAQLRRGVLPMDTAELVARFHELMGREGAQDGLTDTAQQTVGYTRDLRDLRVKVRDHAGLLEDLDAVLCELIEREIDPYDAAWRKGRS